MSHDEEDFGLMALIAGLGLFTRSELERMEQEEFNFLCGFIIPVPAGAVEGLKTKSVKERLQWLEEYRRTQTEERDFVKVK